MRAEGKAFCSDNWYLLAGVLLQKRHTKTSSKRKAVGLPCNGVDLTSHGMSVTAVSAPGANGHVNGHSHMDGDGHAQGNGHVTHTGVMPSNIGANGTRHVNEDGHQQMSGTDNGLFDSAPQPRLQNGSLGDCSGLKHRYSTTADGAVNIAEDQLDELLKVMTALR